MSVKWVRWFSLTLGINFFPNHINFALTEVDRNDISETNSKLKGPIWNLENLKDLSETNSKLKGPIWNFRNLNVLSETNMKLKRLGEVFRQKVIIFEMSHGHLEK